MYPFIHLGPIQIPTYGTTIAIGGLLAYIFCTVRIKAQGLSENDFTTLLLYALIPGFLGAKLLYFITIWPSADWALLFSLEHIVDTLFSGFVFYGGIIGGLVGLLLCKKIHHIEISRYANLIVPAIPLAHAIGRIGCFMAGCCYGIPMDPPLGIAFQNPIGAPAGVPLFPVQLLEAALNLGLFAILWRYTKKYRAPWAGVALYLSLYAIERFALEYLRYDALRGIYFGLSTSQWISVAMLLGGAAFFIYHTKKHLRRAGSV